MPKTKRTPPNTPTPSIRAESPPIGGNGVRSCVSTDNDDSSSTATNVTTRNKRKKQECSCHEICKDLKNELCALFRELKAEQQQNYSSLRTSVDDMKTALEFSFVKYEEILLKFNQLEQEKAENSKQIKTLEDKIDNLERQTRVSTIELRNVPRHDKESKENLLHIMGKLGNTTGESIITSDIKDIFRINSSAKSNNTLVVEFTSVLTKERILKSVRRFNKQNRSNKLHAGHLGFEGNSSPVFVSENLTSKGKRLFHLARDFVTEYKYKYCWSSHGKIYVRKEDKSPRIHIVSEDILFKLKLEI